MTSDHAERFAIERHTAEARIRRSRHEVHDLILVAAVDLLVQAKQCARCRRPHLADDRAALRRAQLRFHYAERISYRKPALHR